MCCMAAEMVQNLIFDDDKIEIMHSLSFKTAPVLNLLGKNQGKSKKGSDASDLMKNPEFDVKVLCNYP